jgi:hypothetical protein
MSAEVTEGEMRRESSSESGWSMAQVLEMVREPGLPVAAEWS